MIFMYIKFAMIILRTDNLACITFKILKTWKAQRKNKLDILQTIYFLKCADDLLFRCLWIFSLTLLIKTQDFASLETQIKYLKCKSVNKNTVFQFWKKVPVSELSTCIIANSIVMT